MDATTIESEAMKLTDEERAHLASRLLSSLSPVPEDLKEAWVREADDRMEAFHKGQLTSESGPEVLENATHARRGIGRLIGAKRQD